MSTAQLRQFFEQVATDDALRARLDAHLRIHGHAADSLIAFARGSGCAVSIDDLRRTMPLPGLLSDAELEGGGTITRSERGAMPPFSAMADSYLSKLNFHCIGVPTD